MIALRQLTKIIPKLLKQYVKYFGVEILVYAPVSLDSMYGGKGSDVKYNLEPIVEGKFFIPAVVKTRNSGSGAMIDPFFEDAQTLYTLPDIHIPNYSKVEVLIKNKAPMLYRVDLPSVTKDDENPFINRYPLIPISDMLAHSFEDISIEEIMDIELESQDDVEDIRDSITQAPTKKSEYEYSPVQ